MRLLLIGQAPGPNTDPRLPLFPLPRTSGGGRLCQLMGLRNSRYLALTERINLLNRYPGKWQNGDVWPLREARIAAESMQPLLAGRRVVLVGRNVADAFDIRSPFHQWTTLQVRRRCPVSGCPGLAEVAVVPHPSGRNHWYNAEDRRAEARAFWAATLGSKENDFSAETGLPSDAASQMM